jgi:hypothetical protein
MGLMNCVGCAGRVDEKNAIQETEVSKSPPPPNENLAPGTANIEASVINFSGQNNHIECIVKIEKVLNYGMSTKPIGKGTELKLHISSDQPDLIKILSGETLEQKYEFTVEQIEMINMPSSQFVYKALRIRKIQSDQ